MRLPAAAGTGRLAPAHVRLRLRLLLLLLILLKKDSLVLGTELPDDGRCEGRRSRVPASLQHKMKILQYKTKILQLKIS